MQICYKELPASRLPSRFQPPSSGFSAVDAHDLGRGNLQDVATLAGHGALHHQRPPLGVDLEHLGVGGEWGMGLGLGRWSSRGWGWGVGMGAVKWAGVVGGWVGYYAIVQIMISNAIA